MSPLLVNRYVSLMLIGDRLEIFFTLLYGELPGSDERRRTDRDGDGRLSRAELDEAKAGWKKRAPDLVSLSLDGQPMPIEASKAEVQVGADDGVGLAPMVVELHASRTLAPSASRERRIRILPGEDPLRLGETEIAVDFSSDWLLVAGGRGPSPASAETRTKFDGPRISVVEDRSVTYVLRPTAPPPKPVARRLVLAIAAGLAFAIAGLTAVAILRRWRSRC